MIMRWLPDAVWCSHHHHHQSIFNYFHCFGFQILWWNWLIFLFFFSFITLLIQMECLHVPYLPIKKWPSPPKSSDVRMIGNFFTFWYYSPFHSQHKFSSHTLHTDGFPAIQESVVFDLVRSLVGKLWFGSLDLCAQRSSQAHLHAWYWYWCPFTLSVILPKCWT